MPPNTRPTHRYCASCKEDSAINGEERCLWCGGETTPQRRRGKPKGVYGKLSDDHLRALHRFHADGGVSVRELGRRIWDRAGFASPGSAATAISGGFKRLELPTRSRSEGSAKSNEARRQPGSPGTRDRAAYRRWLRKKGGGMRQCKATKLRAPEAGRRCQRWAMHGSDFCRNHDPAHRQEVLEHLADLRSRRGSATAKAVA